MRKIETGTYLAGNIQSVSDNVLDSSILLYCKHIIEKIWEIDDLVPSYAYSREYFPGAELKNHRDREACQYSVTLTMCKRGEGNTPYLGAYYGTGGQLSIRGFGSNDGAADSNDKDIMKFVFTPGSGSPHVEIRDYKTSGTEALRITFPNIANPGNGAEWISFYSNGVEFDTIEGDSSGGAVFTGRAAGTTSDLRNKRDIVPVTDTANSLEIVRGLEVIEFAYKSDTREVPERKIGFSAQQLLEVYPQPVSTFEEKNKENDLKPGDTGFKYHKVSEGALAPLLVSAIQEQQKLIEELRQEIDSLKK